MRRPLDATRAMQLVRALGEGARGPGRVYLTGGTSAVLIGWRDSTVDADLKLDPEPAGIFEQIRRVKERLHVNVELASPSDFIPELPGWRERSPWIGRFGEVDVFHYDFYGQALAKLERGHQHDLADVSAMFTAGLIERAKLLELFDAIEPHLLRYPALDPRRFRAKVEHYLRGLDG